MDLLQQVELIETEVKAIAITDAASLEDFRLNYLAKQGKIQNLFNLFREVTAESKKEFGAKLNLLKQLAEGMFAEAKDRIENSAGKESAPYDLTLPDINGQLGSRHPIMLVREQIISIFRNLGFEVADGPEVEDDYHNFTGLNFPENHPAREMQDTFFVEPGAAGAQPGVLRTHTSTVQVRVMESRKPPIRALMPGRVYRNEAISARAHCMFHQVEGLYIDKDISFADLKRTLFHFVKEMFGVNTKIRLRASYFPFTEPSAEIDITCNICGGPGCNMCKHTGWVEIAGCGMVDPNVLEVNGIDSEIYSGFAFGMGLERMTNLKFQVPDLRMFTENDARFIRQFSGS